mmetsp:Transcript_26461/g.92024  ORF Transcript_26461/g.92024 Transcript_26461/m.92024 type:complete len:215 (-) Transcript_26461:538-1182(-)
MRQSDVAHGPDVPGQQSGQVTHPAPPPPPVGQDCVLQVRVCDSDGHAAPAPAAGISTPRVRSCEPWPHVAEQEPHPDHAATVQSTAISTTHSSAAEHATSSTAAPAQSAPPNAGAGCVHVRRRNAKPPPHAAEHAPAEPHSDQPPSIGHATFNSHGSSRLASPTQSTPPCAGAGLLHVRSLTMTPGPHCEEQPPSSIHGPQPPSTGHGCVLHAT